VTGLPPPLLERTDLLRPVLERRPLGLFLDFDGTVSPITPRPQDARILPACRSALERLVGRLDLVAVISGRRAEDVAQRVGVPRVVVVGQHGCEVLEEGRPLLLPEVRPYLPALRRLAREVPQRVAVPNLVVEEKGASLAFHYRLAPDPATARRRLLEALEPAGREGLRVHEGKMMVEVRPPVAMDKGRALERLARLHRLQALLFVGDDWTDRDAFLAVRRLREEGLVGLAVVVLGPETPEEVARSADASLPEVEGTARLLTWLADALTGGPVGPGTGATASG